MLLWIQEFMSGALEVGEKYRTAKTSTKKSQLAKPPSPRFTFPTLVHHNIESRQHGHTESWLEVHAVHRAISISRQPTST